MTAAAEAPAPEQAGPPLQGLGVFAFPEGLLLVDGAGDDVESVRRSLAAGRLPGTWPAALDGVRLAHAGEPRADAFDPDHPAGRYNRWVLDPASATADEVRAALPADHRPLVDVVAWTAGLTDSVPPAPTGRGELAALVHATRASARIAEGDLTAAEDELRAAVAMAPTEVQAATLRADLGFLLLDAGLNAGPDAGPDAGEVSAGAQSVGAQSGGDAAAADMAAVAADVVTAGGPDADSALTAGGPDADSALTAGGPDADSALTDAVRQLRDADRALAGTDLAGTRAQVLLRLGGIAQERAAGDSGDTRAALQEAMRCYYDALRLVSEESEPYLWASLQLNLAAAQLATPMTTATDQLRVGVATQSLRAARRVFTPAEHPGPWSVATLNLANALVYSPSTHQRDNLTEAVDLYEEVLASGVRDGDPAGRARLLANQGNALAHLGALGDARVKLVEARFVFEEQLDHEAVMAVRGVLDEIVKAEQRAAPDYSDDQLARAAEQMARMPAPPTEPTSGMGVQVLGMDAQHPPTPRVTVLRRGPAPADVPGREAP